MPKKGCLTDKETLERIVKLESIFKEKKKSEKEALKLARKLLGKDIKLARKQMDVRLESHNRWQQRWDKMEQVLATKEYVDDRYGYITRYIFVGTGIALTVAIVVPIILKLI